MTPGSNLSQDLRLDLFSPPTSLHCSAHCFLKLIVTCNSCMKQKCFVYITFNSSQLWFISVLDNQKALQNTFQTTTFNVEENSRTFQDCMKHWKQSSFSITITITPLWKNRSKVKPRWFKYRRSFYFKAQQRLKKYESLNKSHNNIATNRPVQIDRSLPPTGPMPWIILCLWGFLCNRNAGRRSNKITGLSKCQSVKSSPIRDYTLQAGQSYSTYLTVNGPILPGHLVTMELEGMVLNFYSVKIM